MSEDYPTLVLLHGLGATPGVWSDVLDVIEWPGSVIMPALAGHASAAWTGDYTIGALAGAVSVQCPDDKAGVIIAGHSLGAGVGLCLASNFFRPRVRALVSLGVKVQWPEEDISGMARAAAKGVRWCETRDQAIDRFLRNAGLAGVVDAEHPATVDSVVEGEGGWRVAQDPATFAQRALDMAGLMGAIRCPVTLAAGENDPMCSADDFSPFVAEPVICPDTGHNVQVENPTWVAAQIMAATAAVI